MKIFDTNGVEVKEGDTVSLNVGYDVEPSEHLVFKKGNSLYIYNDDKELLMDAIMASPFFSVIVVEDDLPTKLEPEDEASISKLNFIIKHQESVNKALRDEIKSLTAHLKLTSDGSVGKGMSPWDGQVGGSHYTDKAVQPLKLTLLNKGYEAFSGACYTKINKYTTRAKDNEVEQLKKARHVLDLWIHEAENNEK